MTATPQSILTQSQISKLKQKMNECQKEILELQKICLHDFKKVWMKLTTNHYQFKVVKYRCTICIAEKERGISNCYICDGKMKYMGYIPDQGGGFHLQKCVECGRNSDSDNYGLHRHSIPEGDFVAEQ